MAPRSGSGGEQAEERLEKTVEMALLYDVYGELLTERQRRFFTLYFLDDLSLGEIGAQFQVSRQAVYDILRRSQRTLERMEARLGLVSGRRRLEARLDELKELARRLEQVLAGPSGDRGKALSLARELRQRLERLSEPVLPSAGEEAADGLRASE